MAELDLTSLLEGQPQKRKLRYRGHGFQVVIYIGKMFRMFINQADWKVLPMAALIAGLVSMVVRRNYFVSMEGTLTGALALTCLSIWNGCFNSIQVVCREREILKREHRSGLHITSYVFSHMVYQAFLCLLQTIITLVVCSYTGIQFPKEGMFTKWLVVDLGISIFLITYASDMLSLFVSSLCRSTTTAMTVMPFVLIFQLVFSGGIFSLPAWADSISVFSISNYGMKCLAAQSDYNGRPLVTAWNTLIRLRDKELEKTVTLGEVLDFMGQTDKAVVQELRAKEINVPSVEEFLNLLKELEQSGMLPSRATTAVKLADIFVDTDAVQEKVDDVVPQKIHLGDLVDALAQNSFVQARRDQSYTFKTTFGELIDLVGEEKLQLYIQEQTAAASYIPAYEHSKDNILGYWSCLVLFIAVFSLISVFSLEFIDKDKR